MESDSDTRSRYLACIFDPEQLILSIAYSSFFAVGFIISLPPSLPSKSESNLAFVVTKTFLAFFVKLRSKISEKTKFVLLVTIDSLRLAKTRVFGI